LVEKEVVHEALGVAIVQSMHERKAMMASCPRLCRFAGGIGTMEEFFES